MPGYVMCVCVCLCISWWIMEIEYRESGLITRSFVWCELRWFLCACAVASLYYMSREFGQHYTLNIYFIQEAQNKNVERGNTLNFEEYIDSKSTIRINIRIIYHSMQNESKTHARTKKEIKQQKFVGMICFANNVDLKMNTYFFSVQ